MNLKCVSVKCGVINLIQFEFYIENSVKYVDVNVVLYLKSLQAKIHYYPDSFIKEVYLDLSRCNTNHAQRVLFQTSLETQFSFKLAPQGVFKEVISKVNTHLPSQGLFVVLKIYSNSTPRQQTNNTVRMRIRDVYIFRYVILA